MLARDNYCVAPRKILKVIIYIKWKYHPASPFVESLHECNVLVCAVWCV